MSAAMSRCGRCGAAGKLSWLVKVRRCVASWATRKEKEEDGEEEDVNKGRQEDSASLMTARRGERGDEEGFDDVVAETRPLCSQITESTDLANRPSCLCSAAAASHRLRPLHNDAMSCRLHLTDIVKLMNAIHVDVPVSGECLVIDRTRNVADSVTNSSPISVITVRAVRVQ